MEAEKILDKDGKALHKLMNNAVYEKMMEKLRNRINVKLVSNMKHYLKWTSKPSHMSQKIFDNDLDLVAICKNKVTLTLSKPVYNGMCILELSKVLMYDIHHDYIKNKYGNSSRLLFTDTDSRMYEIKTEYCYKYFSHDKEIFDCSSNYSSKSKYYVNSDKLVVSKMKYETIGVAIEEFVGLKPKLYSYLVDDNSEHKKSKGRKQKCCSNNIKMFC